MKTAGLQQLELGVMMANRDLYSRMLTELRSYQQQNYGCDKRVHVAPQKLQSEGFNVKAPNVNNR